MSLQSPTIAPSETVTVPQRAPVAKPAVAPRPAQNAPPAKRSLRAKFPRGINPWTLGWMVGMHGAAVAALWYFSWTAFGIFLVLLWVSGSLGVCLGYHRLLTHKGLVLPRPLHYFFTMCGILSAEGSPMFWVTMHRKHHAFSDEEGDPHSPNDGFWWSHMLWLQPAMTRKEEEALFRRWAPDFYNDPVQRFFHRYFVLFPTVVGIALFGVGQWMGGHGIEFLLWGLCARMVACYHVTWFVNSASHIWGYRNYETTDRSRNLWWVGLCAFGEGWHNNHHAHQRLARHGHRWYEFDITYYVIWTLKKLGLATEVYDELPELPAKHL